MTRIVTIACLLGLMQACASTSEPIAAFDYQASAADPARDAMRAVFLNAQASVEEFWTPLDGEIDGGTGFDRAFLLTWRPRAPSSMRRCLRNGV